jgi:pimeloyl-ACP methyl ester carboxylesterase
LFFHGLLQGPFFVSEFVDGLAAAGLTLYAPSRPGFGSTGPAGDYRQDVVDDAIALVDAVGSDSVLLMAHMGGACHAYRTLARLGNRARGVLVVSGGIPIDEAAHFEKMNRYTRIAAAAAKHAPSVMEMIGHVGAAYVKARGHRAYLTRFYEKAAVDLALLDDPLRSQVLFDGLDHLISQGIRAFIHDGQAIMSDWNAALDEAKTPGHWLHGALDPVVAAQHVRRRLADVPSCRLDIVEGTGQGLLHQAPDRVLSALTALCDRV